MLLRIFDAELVYDNVVDTFEMLHVMLLVCDFMCLKFDVCIEYRSNSSVAFS